MKRILIDTTPYSSRIGLIEDGELTEFIYENKEKGSIVGNIYVGRVSSVHKGMQACFVDIGQEKNAYLAFEKGKNMQAYSHVTVQVTKDASSNKGAVLTDKLSFPGKFLVLIPGENGNIGISKKISVENERERIKNIAQNVLPQGYGMIIRTEGVGKSLEDFKEETERLYKVSKEVLEKSVYMKAPCLIYEEESAAVKAARDLFGEDIDEIVINSEVEYNIIKAHTLNRPERVIFYESNIPIFENYFVESQAEKILNKKVWLKSGGFIVIEQTEACVVIDVNTGKYTGKSDFQETIFKINLEAAGEIAKQLRLRNLSGIIIIDFIDMKQEEKKKELKRVLEKAVSKDRIRTTVVGMTDLGLMQLTRKKTSLPLWSKITEECKCCKGNGRVESYDYISDRIRREVLSIFSQTIFNEVTISSSKKILNVFAGKDNVCIKNLEEEFGKKIVLKEIETAAHNYYEIDRKFTDINKE